MSKTYGEIKALSELLAVEEKNNGLINGNFSFFATKWKIKVKRLKELYQESKDQSA